MTTKKETQSTEVAEVKGGVVAPLFLSDEDFVGGGFEGADSDSFAIPFLQILQKMSPICDAEDPRYVEGAKAGHFYNTVTGEIIDGKTGALIIPCAFRRSFIRWGGRESSEGGFKGEITVEEFEKMKLDPTQAVQVDGRWYAPDEKGEVNEKKSDYFADTRSHYVLLVNEETGEFGQALLSLASAQIKASKMLLTALNQKKVKTPGGLKTPPTFANMVRLTTQGMKNEKGNWSGAVFSLEGLVTDANLFENAKAFYKDIISGQVEVDYNKADQGSASGADTEAKPQDADNF